MLQSTGSQRVGHEIATKQQQIPYVCGNLLLQIEETNWVTGKCDPNSTFRNQKERSPKMAVLLLSAHPPVNQPLLHLHLLT